MEYSLGDSVKIAQEAFWLLSNPWNLWGITGIPVRPKPK